MLPEVFESHSLQLIDHSFLQSHVVIHGMWFLRIDRWDMRKNLEIVAALGGLARIRSSRSYKINRWVLRQFTLSEDRVEMSALLLRVKEIMMSQLRVDSIRS